MSALSDALSLGRTRRILSATLSALALAMVLPGASWADHDGVPGAHDADLAFSEFALDDEILARTHGAGEGGSQTVLLEAEEPGDGGSHQSVDIGSFNALHGFGGHNAVAVAIARRDSVQIIGSGHIDDVTGVNG